MQKGTIYLMLLLTLLLSSFTARADWQEDLLKVLQTQDYEALQDFTGTHAPTPEKNPPIDENNYQIYYLFGYPSFVDLTKGHYIDVLSFFSGDIDSTTEKKIECQLIVVHKKNRVIYANLYEMENDSLTVSLLNYQDEVGMQTFQEIFCSVYSWPFNVREYCVGVDELYGFHCGFGGIPPRLRETLNGLVKKRDTVRLSQWLSSGSPVLQAYAVEGLLKLEALGVQLDSKTLKIIDLLLTSEQLVPTCSGCTPWHRKFCEIDFPTSR